MTYQPPMPPQQQPMPGGWAPPPPRGHKLRNGCLGTVAVLVVLVVLGSLAGKPAMPDASQAATQAAPAATGSPTDAATGAPAATDTPAPAPKTLLSLKGSGIKSSKPFTASGDSIDLAYTFDCAAFGSSGNFQVMTYDAGGLTGIAVNALAKKGADSTTVYLASMASPLHLEVNSECAWTITVTGTP